MMNGALRAAVWVALAVVAAGFMQPHIPLAPSTLHTGLTFRARHNAICQRERTFSLRPQCVTGDKPAASERPASPPLPALPGLPTVEIEYCTGCRWLLRAAWLAQELLTTFEGEIARVSIMPSMGRKDYPRGGVFDIRVNGILIWDRKKMGRFPEAKEVKQLVRDIIAPEKYLGHSDVKEVAFLQDSTAAPSSSAPATSSAAGAASVEMMDDDAAEAARRQFGVL